MITMNNRAVVPLWCIASHVSFQQYLAGLSGWNLTVPVGHHFAGKSENKRA